MVLRDRIIFASLIALALGFCGGYLFSSKFCKVTIVKRVEKEVALNQTLRQLLASHSFWVHNFIHANVFNTSDKQAIENRLIKNQDEIAQVIEAYYGKSAASELAKLLGQHNTLIEELATNESLSDLNLKWEKNAEDIATFFAKLNPEWAFVHDKLKSGINQQFSLINKEIEALKNNNGQRAIDFFEKQFNLAMQFADEINRGITQQFPNKF